MLQQAASWSRSRRSLAFIGVRVAIAVAGIACGDSRNTEPLVATNISVRTGSDAQTGVVGQSLATPISIVVVDQNGAPMANVPVAWTVEANGGTISAPTTTTDANGATSITWTLGTVAGVDSLVVRIASGASTTITATGSAAGLVALSVVSGDQQSVTAGSATAPLIVKAVDQFGNAVSNATVTWLAAGGGTLSASTSVTDANGLAQVTLTTDAVPGAYTVTATSGGSGIASFTINGT